MDGQQLRKNQWRDMSERIRLSEDDYIKLYPLWRPIDIQKEFQFHAHCESQIRNYYRRLKYGTQGKAYKSLVKVYMNDRPDNVSLADWKAKINSEIEEAKEKAAIVVWESIEARKKVRGNQ